MDIDKIAAIFQKRLGGGSGLPLVIGIDRAGGTGNPVNLHAGPHGNALQQVHRGDHGTLQAGFLPEVLQTGLGSGTPEPEGIGLVLPLPCPLQIQRVHIENRVALFHHLFENFLFGKPRADDRSQMVMGGL